MEIVEVDHAFGGYTIVAWGELELRNQSPPLDRVGQSTDMAFAIDDACADHVAGWAVSPKGLNSIWISIDGKFAGRARTGIARPDIGAQLPDIADSDRSASVNGIRAQAFASCSLLSAATWRWSASRRISDRSTPSASAQRWISAASSSRTRKLSIVIHLSLARMTGRAWVDSRDLALYGPNSGWVRLVSGKAAD